MASANKIDHVKTKLFFFAGAMFAIIGRVGAGSIELAPKETTPPSITESQPWQFTIAAPGWIAGLDGTSALSWRLFNQPRWSLDFAAGTHYTNVYERLELHSDPIAIQQASVRFVDNISAALRERLDNDISDSEFLADLKRTIATDIANRIGNALDRHEHRPDIPIGPLGGRIREEIAQRVEHFIELKKAELRARIDALVERGLDRRAAVDRVVNEAKARIANQLAVRLNKRLSQTLSRTDYWFDPYLGLRGRYNFNKTFYTAVRGEIGGFGVGADLMWEVEAVVGINLTRNIFTEVGYRALGADYENDGLLFDAVMHGPQITTGITF